MDSSAFAATLRRAILNVWEEFIAQHAADRPYAFALIGNPSAEYLGYAIATETGLQRLAAEYENRGYRYRGWEWEDFDNRQKLATWLRWANPDDGWLYGDFAEQFHTQATLTHLVKARAFGEDSEDFEEFCTEVLASLIREQAWKRTCGDVALGFTYGEDPRDFLRTATRANSYRLVRRLWAEYWQGETLPDRIPSPK